jgi:tetratricopeptide (TPR) repeat protein
MRKLGVLALLAVVGACAPKTIPAPAPVISAPKFPDFVQPVVPPALASGVAAASQSRGWSFLQAGDLKSAEREFGAALTNSAGFYPAEAALGYVELARKDARAALPHFDRALERQHDYVAALLGRGQALLALNREPEALEAFDAAVAADPSLTDLKRTVEVLRFRELQQDLAGAREAGRSGRLDEAVRAYNSALASSPDSPFLYRELASVERQKGDVDRALDHFREALTLDPTDVTSLVQIGDILDTRGDVDGAAKAYGDALAIEPSGAVEAKLEQVRARTDLARMPEEYRAIGGAAQITRADLAALIGVRLAPLLQAGRRSDAVLITDLRNSWAAIWILAVARAGVMEAYANHAFQPRTVVRRVDLAQAVNHLLERIATANPARAQSWQASRVKFLDISAGHLAYPAASAAIASGVMTVGVDNSFQPSRPVSGPEALEVIGRIEAIAGMPSPAKGQGQR